MDTEFTELKLQDRWSICSNSQRDFSGLFTLVLLQICETFCRIKKLLADNTDLYYVLCPVKRSVLKQPDEAKANPRSLSAHVTALTNKLV